ncbi:clathrin light chain isoform X2 [Cylas formicarius]|uniref:clathrin light chain isoform X2 n=1 Tax=Cylas formicarius TaxID=197179 RepID=UPI002958D1FE|nr:clathrin light chain isoform X2 [Cylas formicarius]
MSGFGANFDQIDADPAAEFLAREQDELAGLEDEVKPAAIAVTSLVNGDDPTNSASSFEMVEGFDAEKHNFGQDELLDIKKEQYDAPPSPPTSLTREPREEPEKIKKWREDQVKRLEEKDREEDRKREELRQIAKKELEDWYKNHEETIAKTKAANRSAEKQFVAEDNDIQPGTEWERIAKLCDFNAKTKPGSKDVSRMRSIILQMKQYPVAIKPKA